MATPSLQSLERGLAILKALNQIPGMGIDSLAAMLQLSRGTTYRLLETLRRDGYITRDGGRGKYAVTERVLCLSDGCRAAGELQDQAQPVLDDLSARYRWPVAIATPDGADMVLRATTDHKTPYVKRRYSTGSRRPMLFCSSGRVYLAHCNTAHREAMLSLLETLPINKEPLRAKHRDELARLLSGIQREGYSAYENAEHVTTLSVPIYKEEKVAGALLMRYFSSTMNVSTACERILPGLKQAANRISGTAQRSQRAA